MYIILFVWAHVCRVDLAVWKNEDVPDGSDTYIHGVCNLGVLERKQIKNICVLSDSFFEF